MRNTIQSIFTLEEEWTFLEIHHKFYNLKKRLFHESLAPREKKWKKSIINTAGVSYLPEGPKTKQTTS